MDKPRLLSGYELVARGITKIDASLPEVGLKDVVPNGSWLEQKQIQSALEARKHVIEVERIQKSGMLSHAEWREELMLAEVTRNVGGHWQYFGHSIGKQLYLKPEEALFLIEVNCLKLTYNEVTVSIQQAYSLLLRSKVSLHQYKVYASLSRIGYKVYRHEEKKLTGQEKKNNVDEKTKIDIDTMKSKGKKAIEDNNDDQMEVDDCADKNICRVKNECESTQELPKLLEQKQLEYCESNKDAIMNVDCDETAIETTDLSNVDEISKVIENNDKKEENYGEGNETAKKDTTNGAETDCNKVKIASCVNPPANDINGMNNFDGTEIDENKDYKITDMDNVSSTDCGDNEQHVNEKIFVNDTEMVVDSTYTNNAEKKQDDLAACAIDINIKSPNLKPFEKTNNKPESFYQYKLNRLENRKLRALNVANTEKCFGKVPDIPQKQTISVDAPEEKYIPRNVFLNNISYVLNLDTIKSTTKTRTQSTESRPYNSNEEVNGEHIKRIKAATSGNTPVTTPPPLFSHNRFSRPHFQNFWRPNMNFFPYNFMFQRPFIHNNFVPRFRSFNPRPSLLGMYPGFNCFQPNAQKSMPNENKKRRNSTDQKNIHLNAIKGLASRLRLIVQSGNTQQQNVDALQRLISTFNLKYNMRLRLKDNFEIFNDETIVETITLDEDEEPRSKKTKTEDDEDKYKENFNKLKQLALKLKGLEYKDEVNSRHRRAFSNLIKKFNKAYNAEVYLNSNFQVIDRKFIDLDSSSDSDCVIEETAKAAGTKKLKNPFNILKRLSEKQVPGSSNSAKKASSETEDKKDNNYSSTTLEAFSKDWLPSEDDFGRAEIMPRNQMNSYLIESKKEEFLFEYLKSQPYEFDNWLDIKISFLKSFGETDVLTEDIADTPSLSSLVEPGDCIDMPSVLKKLSIILPNKEIDSETRFKIDFDVYNRDVQNFRKTNRPKPHFRIVCVSESSSFPSGKDVASLHSRCEDNVAIVFAVVGVGSVSYLQINPIELPVYIPSNDLD